MIWVLICILVFLLLLILILFTKIKVFFHYYHGQDNDDLQIKFKALFGLVQYKLSVPMIKVDENSPSLVFKEKVEKGKDEIDQKQDTKKFTTDDLLNTFHDAQLLLKHIVGLHKIIRKFLKKVTVRNIEWQSVVGVQDAAYTGMITGAFWAVKGSIIGLISAYMRVRNIPQVMITPSFNRAISKTSFKCMIQFRIGHAIFAGIKLFKFWKGGFPNFKTKPLQLPSKNKTKSV